MQFIYGLLTAAVFFLCLIFAFYLGTRLKQKKPPDIESEEREKEKRQIEKFNKHFKALFEYDVDKALQRKKV